MIPIDVLPLFPELNKSLVSFLKSLSPSDWEKQTVARLWKIKDVAAHLLDGNYRRIALHRDGWSSVPDQPIRSYNDLVNYLNGLNADWVKATKRLSPQMLVEQLEWSNQTVFRLFSELDPFAESAYPVSWAGEDRSYNWFDIAREYTERWLHQQQIREAMGNRDILTKQFYHPFLDIFMYAWPVAMNGIGEKDMIVKTIITGEGGGEWLLKMDEPGKWTLHRGTGEDKGNVIAETIIDDDAAWKLFSKSVRKEQIKDNYKIKGDHYFGEKILDMVSVMA